jgi:GTP-binding protein
MNPVYRSVTFLTSAARLSQAPPDVGWEVAFAGRSNAGKSSAINALCAQHSLTRTSKTPGRTQLLNFFRVDAERRLVDLPGYGYAKVAEAVKRRWQGFMVEYLSRRRCLRGVVLLMDIRHPLSDYDRDMLDWNAGRGLPTHVLLTKADKLKRGPGLDQLQRVARALEETAAPVSIQLFSSLKRQGIDQAHALLDEWLELPTGRSAAGPAEGTDNT